MIEFVRDLPTSPLLVNGLLAGLVAGIACGAIGPLVVTRRLVFLVGAIAHVAVGGIGAAAWLRHVAPTTFGWCSPDVGAAVAGVLAAIVLSILRAQAHERLDTLVGAVWAVGMSGGLLLLGQVPGARAELSSSLFGNLAAVPTSAVWLAAILTAVLLITVAGLAKQLEAVVADPEHARLRGIRVTLLDTILLVLVALAVVVLVRVTGLLLVLALLTLPAATAGHWVHRLPALTWLAGGLACVLTTVPRAAVYGLDVSPESTIVLAAAGTYLLSVVVRGRFVRRGRRAAATDG